MSSGLNPVVCAAMYALCQVQLRHGDYFNLDFL